MSNENTELIYESNYFQLLRRGSWEFLQRRGVNGVVQILALTDQRKVVFVEQYRVPVESNVIEFPAGLSGDLPGEANEALENAARRELLEETGYEAGTMKQVFCGPTSAGLTDEKATIFVARDLKKVEQGGGVEDEQIVVHEIPLESVHEWLDEKQQQGNLVGARVYTGLYFLHREIESSG